MWPAKDAQPSDDESNMGKRATDRARFAWRTRSSSTPSVELPKSPNVKSRDGQQFSSPRRATSASASLPAMNHLVTLSHLGGSSPGGSGPSSLTSSLSASGLPAVRMSTMSNLVLPSTFHFEPIPDTTQTAFNQAGGHEGTFKAQGPILVKKVSDREATFYEDAARGSWPERFLPNFYGRTDDGTSIRIENLTYGYKRPCVMDLKMGFQSVEDSEQSFLKKIRHAALDLVTGSKHSGVRLEGLSMYRTLENRRMKGTKAQSHSVSAHLGISLQDVLTFFLTDESGVRTDIALRFQSHIESLLEYFKWHNNKHLFIGSSILLIYDNDNSSPHMRWARALQRLHTIDPALRALSSDQVSALTRRTQVDVRMIDFAHTGSLPAAQHRDFGYIQGLETILTALKEIRANRMRPIFTVANAAIDAMERATENGGTDDASDDSKSGNFNFDSILSQCSRLSP